jgi:4-hydroxy-tetrahydrodipicolinate synthase
MAEKNREPGSGSRLPAEASAKAGEPEDGWRGIFAVLQTPLREDGSADERSMRRQVDFCAACGGHGLVFPVLGAEFQYLAEFERRDLLRVVVDQSAGNLPVVAGVAGPSRAVAAPLAADAAEAGANAVIALPPYVSPATPDEIFDYYRAISDACGLPIFVQHAKLVPMAPAFLVRLLTEIDNVAYIKEERDPSAHNISQVAKEMGDKCRGIFGGGHGRWMLSEMARGATGFMPAAQSLDIYVKIWDAYQAGEHADARNLFNCHLPLINLIILLGLPVCKEMLVRRGVITTNKMRTPGANQLDEGDHIELTHILNDLEELYTV